MKKNVGGIAIAVAGLVFQSWWGLVALIPLGTAALSVSPLYLPLGV